METGHRDLGRRAAGLPDGLDHGKFRLRPVQRWGQVQNEPEIRDDAAKILGPMVTESGTKHPRSLSELVEITGLEDWRTKGCLLQLHPRGLVRALDQSLEQWEIAHDFLAWLVGQLLGRIRRPWWRASLPFVAPALLAWWLGTVFLAFLYWQEDRVQQVRDVLNNLGLLVRELEAGSGFQVMATRQFGGLGLARAGQTMAQIPLIFLDLERMARPIGKWFWCSALFSLLQRIRSQGRALAKMEIRAARSS